MTRLARSSNQPQGMWSINWSHPLTRGLRFLVATDGASGFIEYVRQSRATRNNSAAATQRIPRSGMAPAWMAKLASATSDNLSVVHDLSYNLLGDMTLLWSGQINTASAFRSFMCKTPNNGATGCPFEFRTDNAAAGSSQPVCVIEGLGFTSSSPTTVIPIGRPFMIGVTHGLTDAFVVFSVNGGYTPTTPGATATPTSTSAVLSIGRRLDGAVQMDGFTEFAMGWARKMTPDEMAALYRDPYQILNQSVRRIYVGEAAGGSGGFFSRYYYDMAA